MALPLKYNTASQTIILGPFLDDTDGKTPKTALTIANTDIKLKKHNGTSDTNKNSGGATHIANGYYYTTLDATDTDTIGRLIISVNATGALPVWHEFIVYPAEVFDYLFAAAGTDYMKVDIAQIDGVALGTHTSGEIPSDLRYVAGTAQTARDLGAQCDTTISSRAAAATALSNATWTDTKAGYIDAAISSRSSHTAADVWAVGTRALTDKAGFTISGTKTTLDALNDITAASVWSVATRALTDKSGFDLSTAGIDAIWDRASAVTLSFENLLIRAYEMINNKMTVNETTGAVTLRNIGDTANVATGSVTSSSGTTTRAELSWS